MNVNGIRIAVTGLNIFEAASGIIGAVGLVAGFMDIPVSVLSGTPFTDFTVPALLLGLVVGGSALVAAVITAFGPPSSGALASVVAGCITVGYLTVEIAMIGLGAWPQVVWLLVGVLMIGLAALLWQAGAHAAGVSASRQPISVG